MGMKIQANLEVIEDAEQGPYLNVDLTINDEPQDIPGIRLFGDNDRDDVVHLLAITTQHVSLVQRQQKSHVDLGGDPV